MIVLHSAPITTVGLTTNTIDITGYNRIGVYVSIDDYLTSTGFYIEPRFNDGGGLLSFLGSVIPATVTLVANTCINVEAYATRFNFDATKHPTTRTPLVFSFYNPGMPLLYFDCKALTNDTGDIEIAIMLENANGFLLP